ncbi:MAG: CoA transferase [Chloroflexi bacterium]|nr:CoA transferase [Chloroflexota bacterium]
MLTGVNLPLQGIRVLELSVAWAAPFCGKNLSFFGAEVIKVEAPTRPDGHRGSINPAAGGFTIYPNGVPGERPWNRTGAFAERHRDKLGLSVDLNASEGKELFKRLVALSDVVMVNYRAGVMDRLGLGYDVLKQVNPGLVMVLLPGFGNTGPYRDYSSYGSNLEALTGAAGLTGYPDREPLNSNLTWPDPVVGMMALGTIVAALRHRSVTGEGMLMEYSQLEVAVRTLGGFLMDYSMNGRAHHRIGNRDPVMAPHGVYPCQGEDQWLAVAVASDAEWRALCGVMSKPELAEDPRFADGPGRLRNHDALDEIIAGWSSAQDKMSAFHALQAAGVAAGPVLAHAEHFTDPHFRERGFFQEIYHPEAGTFPFQAVNGFKLSRTPGRNRRSAPLYGEHNRYLLQDVLGLGDEDLAHLEARQVISQVPLADSPRAL